MAEIAESGGDAQITFKVKSSADRNHTITMAESATVLELKTKLAGGDFEDIPVERQRLIYSGRVMKNDDTLGSYKIKANNTIHLVKSAASNPAPQSSTSGPTPRAVPENISAGTNPNDPLAGLTGARYAGHSINLPGMDMFGPDGGMGPPMDEERFQRMMSDPNVQMSMNEALNNPDFINMLIESNPMLRNVPNARDIITSPFMRQMMTNPQMMSQAMRMQRNMRGGEAAFPAPGATDTTPGDSAAPDMNNMNFLNNLGDGRGGPDMAQVAQALNSLGLGNTFMFPTGTSPSTAGNTQQSQSQTAQGTQQAEGNVGGARDVSSLGAANPFATLFPRTSPEMLEHFARGLRGELHTPVAADSRPPEERYAEQLRQLNDMGFYDFDRNVAALRRSGGNVQGAIEYLLGATD